LLQLGGARARDRGFRAPPLGGTGRGSGGSGGGGGGGCGEEAAGGLEGVQAIVVGAWGGSRAIMREGRGIGGKGVGPQVREQRSGWGDYPGQRAFTPWAPAMHVHGERARPLGSERGVAGAQENAAEVVAALNEDVAVLAPRRRPRVLHLRRGAGGSVPSGRRRTAGCPRWKSRHLVVVLAVLRAVAHGKHAVVEVGAAAAGEHAARVELERGLVGLCRKGSKSKVEGCCFLGGFRAAPSAPPGWRAGGHPPRNAPMATDTGCWAMADMSAASEAATSE